MTTKSTTEISTRSKGTASEQHNDKSTLAEQHATKQHNLKMAQLLTVMPQYGSMLKHDSDVEAFMQLFQNI